MECTRSKKTGMFVGIDETNSPCWTCTVDTQVTDIPFVLSVLVSFFSMGSLILETWEYSIPEHIKYNTQV